MNITSTVLDIFSLPIEGIKLIEASAGTGKTYAIEILYLRLLLGLNKNNLFSKPLNVKEILVVTFTESSTVEFRKRIRRRIHEMRLLCLGDTIGFEDKYEYTTLLKLIKKSKIRYVINLLTKAEYEINEASIYTIHGFCKQILTFYAIESKSLFKQNIIEDESLIQKQAVIDFWRRNFYNLDYSITTIIESEWGEPENLLIEIKPFLQIETPLIINLNKKKETLKTRHYRLISLILDIKSIWLLNVINFEKLIKNSDVNKRIYNKKHLSFWLCKITEWAKKETIDYFLPKELIRFSQNELNEKSKNSFGPKHIVFQKIEKLLTESFTIKDIIIPIAIDHIKKFIAVEKYNLGVIGFNDLLINLYKALSEDYNKLLAKSIIKHFPVAIIDEFQDTDNKQYQIFQKIYQDFNNIALLFIGDPKQSIYSFRGADIFTYFNAKKQLNNFYTLNNNYRSSKSLVKAINYIFTRCENPFFFKQIKYQPVNFVQKNINKKLIHNGKEVKAFIFWYIDLEVLSVSEYERIICNKCANQISEYLLGGLKGNSYFLDNKENRFNITASDITILVRTHREAKLIRNALDDVNISSVFQSSEESVFSTQEARDLLLILEAIVKPENKFLLRNAVSTCVFGLNLKDIENLNSEKFELKKIFNEFNYYKSIWDNYGILSMIRFLILHRKISENLLSDVYGKRKLMNLMHISEILQEISLEITSKYSLIRWLSQQINSSNKQLNKYNIRVESDDDLVKINTIHKSKGLEYKIIWLPFASNFLCQSKSLYHDRKDFSLKIDLFNNKKTLLLADEERLSEDLRLLYVAFTRGIYHCSVGVAPLIKRNRKKNNNTDFHLSALGYLLQKKQIGDCNLLKKMLAEINNENIEISLVNLSNNKKIYEKEENKEKLLVKTAIRKLIDNWNFISYSTLKCNYISSTYHTKILQNNSLNFLLNKNLNNTLDNDISDKNIELIQTHHQFPNGLKTGILLHSLMKEINFSKNISLKWISNRLDCFGFNKKLAKILQKWLFTIINIKLTDNGLSLCVLKNKNLLTELEFCLYIKNVLKAKDIDKITHKYDPISQQCAPLVFDDVYGILNGFIDLVFFWEKKIYLLDYKTNYLGKDSSFYTQIEIEKSMINNRYDLQYQFYLIAIHRYLKQKIINYDYNIHFGGIYYLFLRGLDNLKTKNGIFFYYPSFEFINELDKLF